VSDAQEAYRHIISPSIVRDIDGGATSKDCAIVEEISKKASVIELVNFIFACGFECFLLALCTRDGVILAPWPLLCGDSATNGSILHNTS
jgi:hypothetical protein